MKSDEHSMFHFFLSVGHKSSGMGIYALKVVTIEPYHFQDDCQPATVPLWAMDWCSDDDCTSGGSLSGC